MSYALIKDTYVLVLLPFLTFQLMTKLTETWLRFLQHCVRESTCREVIAADSFYKQEVNDYLKHGADNHKIVVPIAIAVSFLCSDDDVMTFEASAMEHLLMVLKNAIDSKHKDNTYHFEGWFAHDVTNCIAKLAANAQNLQHVTKSGAVFKHLIKMTSFEDHTDQECALNALWTLLNRDTYDVIVSDGDFVERLHGLINKGAENVKLAAQRLAQKLQAQGQAKLSPANVIVHLLLQGIVTSEHDEHVWITVRNTADFS